MTARLAALALAATLAVAACRPPAAPTAAPAATDLETNLIFNGSLEDWEGGIPKAWGLAQGAEHEWRQVEGKPVRGVQPGSTGIEITAPPEGQLAILAQNVPTKELRPGRTLYFAVQAYADIEGAAAAVLTWGGSEGQQKVRAVHPGGGTWQRLEGTTVIPRSANLGTFRIELFRMPGGGRVFFDEAGIAVRDGERTP